MPEKPRPVVPDLEDTPQLRPQAHGVDTYARPGQVEYGRPAQTNPFLQLSQALASVEPTLRAVTASVSKDYSEAEYAKGEADYNANREVVNGYIKSGQFPEGASPFYVKAIQRASLRQLGAEFQSAMKMAYFGDEGTEARRSDNPAGVTELMAKVRENFANTYLKEGDKKLFTDLDIHEVFNPLAEQAYKATQSTHAQYRVQEREAEAENTASASMGITLSGLQDRIDSGYVTDNIRTQRMADTAKEIQAIFDDPKDGLRTNGMVSSVKVDVGGHTISIAKSSKLMVDTITANAEKFRNPELLDVMNHIGTKSGSLGATAYATARSTATREHIASENHRTDVVDRYNRQKNSGLHDAQDAQAIEQLDWAKAAATRAATNFEQSQDDRSKNSAMQSYKTQAFLALEAGRKEDVDGAIHALRLIDNDAAVNLEKSLGEITKLRHDITPSRAHDLDYAQIDSDMHLDPGGYSREKLVGALASNRISLPDYTHFSTLLTTLQQDGDNPMMRSPQFKSALTSLSNAIGKDPYDPANQLAQLEVPKALHDARTIAGAWIKKNPQGSQAEFDGYMAEQITKVAERHSTEVATQLKAENDTKKAEQDKLKTALEQAKKVEDARESVSKERVDAARKVVKDGGVTNPLLPNQSYDKPNDRHISALRQDGTLENIAAFRKKFGAEAVPSDLQERTNEGRKILHLPDGSIETEKTITFQDKTNENRWVNWPTIFDGRHVSEKEAIQKFYDFKGVDPDTGRKVKYYYEQNTAEIAARERSARLGKEYQKFKQDMTGDAQPATKPSSTGAAVTPPQEKPPAKPETAPNSRLEVSKITQSGRYFIDGEEIMDLKRGEIISVAEFNKRASDADKNDIERILRETDQFAD